MAIFDSGFLFLEKAEILHTNPNRAQDDMYKISTQNLNVYGQGTWKYMLIF